MRKKLADATAEAALDRTIVTARLAAATLFGESAGDGIEDCSPRVALMATGMVYFLCRLDPGDIAALLGGKDGGKDGGMDGLGRAAFVPFPPAYRPERQPVESAPFALAAH